MKLFAEIGEKRNFARIKATNHYSNSMIVIDKALIRIQKTLS